VHVGGSEDEHGLPGSRLPGDIVLVWMDQPWRTRLRLAHAVVLVDRNVVFEKAGTGDTTPYRMIDIGTVQRAWDPELFRYEVRRPKLGPETAETPVQRFSIAATAPSAFFPQFWRWPQALQRRFALGVADGDSGQVDCLTLLEIEEHRLRYDGRRWQLAG